AGRPRARRGRRPLAAGAAHRADSIGPRRAIRRRDGGSSWAPDGGGRCRSGVRLRAGQIPTSRGPRGAGLRRELRRPHSGLPIPPPIWHRRARSAGRPTICRRQARRGPHRPGPRHGGRADLAPVQTAASVAASGANRRKPRAPEATRRATPPGELGRLPTWDAASHSRLFWLRPRLCVSRACVPTKSSRVVGWRRRGGAPPHDPHLSPDRHLAAAVPGGERIRSGRLAAGAPSSPAVV
ncbi:hypothetical protein JHW43_009599, partial [Diplocarpon mali]